MKKQLIFLLFSFIFFTQYAQAHRPKDVYLIIKNISFNPVTIRVRQRAAISSYYFTVEPFKTDFKLFNTITKLEYSSNNRNFYPLLLPDKREYHLRILFTDAFLSLMTYGCIASHDYQTELIEKYE
jgi:hypothetical protein